LLGMREVVTGTYAAGGRQAGWTVPLVLCAGLLLAPPIVAPAAAAEQPTDGPRLINAVVAAVDGKPITLRELEIFEKGRARLLSPPERKSRATILDAMVKSRLFKAEFDKNGITATDEDVGLYIDSILADGGSSREQVKAALENIGLTWDDYFARMREEVEKFALINREIRTRVNVTPEEVERYWRDNPQYVHEDSVEIGHIYLPFPPRADDAARDQVRTAASAAYEMARTRSFEEAARRYSQGPTAQEGGTLGIFGRGQMAPDFEHVVTKLDTGEISEPFEAGGAMHILKLIKKYPAGRIPLEDVREKIRAKLYDQALDARFKRWVDEDLRNRHHVTVMLDDLPSLPGA
jgi:peptidyl-prolyl cis-trans isomerase SurA